MNPSSPIDITQALLDGLRAGPLPYAEIETWMQGMGVDLGLLHKVVQDQIGNHNVFLYNRATKMLRLRPGWDRWDNYD